MSLTKRCWTVLVRVADADGVGSRLTRLIPLADNASTADELERGAIFDLLAYRFPDDASEKIVREIWGEIVEGRSALWKDIGDDKKECIRGEPVSEFGAMEYDKTDFPQLFSSTSTLLL